MLEGLLVDLVPYGDRFKRNDHTWMNRESLFWGSMGDRFFTTQAGVERRHQRHAEREGPRHEVIFGIQTKPDAPEPCKPLGMFGINWMTPQHRLGMLGALIHEPEYWSGGYGTDALLLFVDYAFDFLDLHKLWLMTMGLNVRVLRQMEKVGFMLDARTRDATYVDGVGVDAVFFGLLREEWPGRAAMIERLGLEKRD
ncbi:MAG: GNAT family N-acetyltransferase [Anaerolineae bacterium]|nr:GNAT family N-acetyltransferase [Anaerolineae bacterium]